MSVRCPACSAVYEGEGPMADWLTCAACGRVWRRPSSADVEPASQLVALEGQRQLARQPSEEYLPETGAVEQVQAAEDALTQRRDGMHEVGIQAALQQHLAAAPLATADDDPSSASRGAVRLDLFDEIEQQVDRSRSEMPTQPVVGPVPHEDDLPTVDDHASIGEEAEVDDEPDELGRQLTEANDDVDFRADPLIGMVVGGCRIDRKLGEGGMGSVYHALQLRLDRSVAVKVLPPEMKRNTKFLKRFEHEAKSLARINHPNILHIYDFGEDEEHGLYYMIMEFVAGEDLAEVLARERRLEQVRALDIIAQALAGLECAAQSGVVHRDIKPDNLMLTAEGTCKVSDFGLAKDAAAMTQVTNMGVRVGTPAFMSPEQCDGETLDWRSDVYSLGVTLYVCLTGALPFNGESPFAIMLKHKSQPPPLVSERQPEVDSRIDALVRQMMAKDRGQRARSLADLRQELATIADDLTDGEGYQGRPRSSGNYQARGGFAVESSDDHLPPLPAGVVDGLAQRPELPSPPPLTSSPISPLVDAAPPSPFGTPSEQTTATSDIPELRPGLALGAQVEGPSSSRLHERASLSQTPLPATRTESPVSATGGSPRESAARRGTESEAGRRRRNREMGQLARRQSEVFRLEEEGDRLFAAGKVRPAIASWQQAAQLGSQWQVRESMFRKIDSAKLGLRLRRRRRVLVVLLLLIITVLAGGYLATPWLHRELARRDFNQAQASESAEVREARLRALIERYQTAPWWCRVYGRDTVEVPALLDAREAVDALVADRAHRDRVDRTEGALADLKQALQDPYATWQTVRSATEQLVDPTVEALLSPADRQLVQQTHERAVTALQALSAVEARVSSALRDGELSGMLAAIGELRSDPRLHPLLTDLPQAQPLRVVDADGRSVDGLRVTIDGRSVRDFDGQAIAYRSRPVTVEVSAPGYIRQQITLPAGPATDERSVQLYKAVAWRQEGVDVGDAAWLRWLPVDAERSILHGPRAVACIDLADGTGRWTFDPATAGLVGNDDHLLWTKVATVAGGGLVLASDQGDVVRFDLTSDRPQAKRLIARRHPVVEWLTYELDLQPGVQAQAWLERDSIGVQCLVGVGDQVVQAGRTSGADTLPLQLLNRHGRLYLVGDDFVHIRGDKGREIGSKDIGEPRIAAGVWMADGAIWAYPSVNGLRAVDFATVPSAFTVHGDALSWPGEFVVLASDGREAAVLSRTAETSGRLQVVQWASEAGWSTVWQVDDLPVHAGADLWMDRSSVVFSSGDGRVRVFDRQDGAARFGYDHQGPIAAAAVHTGRLLVYDANQRLVIAFDLR